MDKTDKIQTIRKILAGEGTNKERRKLRKKLMDSMHTSRQFVKDYVLSIAYTNKDLNRPYLQIFTKDSYLRMTNYRKEIIKEENRKIDEANQKKAVEELEEKYQTD